MFYLKNLIYFINYFIHLTQQIKCRPYYPNIIIYCYQKSFYFWSTYSHR